MQHLWGPGTWGPCPAETSVLATARDTSSGTPTEENLDVMTYLSQGDRLCIKAYAEIRKGSPEDAAKAFVALLWYMRECEEQWPTGRAPCLQTSRPKRNRGSRLR